MAFVAMESSEIGNHYFIDAIVLGCGHKAGRTRPLGVKFLVGDVPEEKKGWG